MELKLISDSGHGWLKVPRHMIEQLNLTDKISEYSYQKGGFVYLEEDRDMKMFKMTCTNSGIDLEIKEEVSNGYSEIRNYDQYKPDIIA